MSDPKTNEMTKRVFLKKWIFTNTLALFVGYLLYTPIGYGFTGTHGREMTTEQIAAHCVALAVVGLILFISQRSVLRHFIPINRIKIAIAALTFIGLFWFGYYQTIIPGGLDYDILFSYLALGSGLWISTIPFSKNKMSWVIALLSFPFASFIGELILFIIYTSFDLNMDVQSNTTNHSIFWITVGVTTGLLGGLISGNMLYRMLKKPIN